MSDGSTSDSSSSSFVFSPFGPPQPGSRGPGIIALSVVCIVLTVIFVGGRLTRCFKVRALRWDDAFIILSALTLISLAIVDAIAVKYGNGLHVSNLGLARLHAAVRIPLGAAPLGAAAIGCAKLSVGLVLLHIDINKLYKAIIVLSTVLGVAGNLQNVIIQGAACRIDGPPGTPPSNGPHCFYINTETYSAYVEEGINIAVDLVYVLVPILCLRKIKLSPRDRMAMNILLLFMLTATVVAICKLTYLPYFAQESVAMDITWANVPLGMYTIAEATLCIIAACLPAIRQLFGNRFPKLLLFTQRSQTTKNTSGVRSIFAGWSRRSPKQDTHTDHSGYTKESMADIDPLKSAMSGVHRNVQPTAPHGGIQTAKDIRIVTSSFGDLAGAAQEHGQSYTPYSGSAYTEKPEKSAGSYLQDADEGDEREIFGNYIRMSDLEKAQIKSPPGSAR